jgi:hypothetical protein
MVKDPSVAEHELAGLVCKAVRLGISWTTRSTCFSILQLGRIGSSAMKKIS